MLSRREIGTKDEKEIGMGASDEQGTLANSREVQITPCRRKQELCRPGSPRRFCSWRYYHDEKRVNREAERQGAIVGGGGTEFV